MKTLEFSYFKTVDKILKIMLEFVSISYRLLNSFQKENRYTKILFRV